MVKSVQLGHYLVLFGDSIQIYFIQTHIVCFLLYVNIGWVLSLEYTLYSPYNHQSYVQDEELGESRGYSKGEETEYIIIDRWGTGSGEVIEYTVIEREEGN